MNFLLTKKYIEKNYYVANCFLPTKINIRSKYFMRSCFGGVG